MARHARRIIRIRDGLIASDDAVKNAGARGRDFFNEFKEGLWIAWDAIRANKMRAGLTTLGIIIGIVSVTADGRGH